MGLTAPAADATARLLALIEAGLPGGTAPVHTALLLLNIATGQEEVRLYSQIPGDEPGHETSVFHSEAPHGLFALGLIAALHAHRLHNWRPLRDGYMPGVIDLKTRRVTGQIGWAIDLRHPLDTDED
ncbi:hypothetical protein ACFC0S_16160 [Streptomyces sp. NPDC056084]|uniref:hypothetical protein n=1 Tax=unclassified Streptomyces TaxID=2593676 RepID=UPI0035DB37BE